MKVLIIEDEAPAARRLQRRLERVDPAPRVVGVVDGVEATRRWLERARLDPDLMPDLLIVDIELCDGSAFELFETRPGEDSIARDLPVIFCTAYDEYAVRAFRAHSVDYLLKPVSEAALQAAIDKWSELESVFGGVDRETSEERRTAGDLDQAQASHLPRRSRFLVKRGRRLRSIALDDVAYFWTHQKLVRLVTLGGDGFFVERSLEDLEDALDPDAFFRINRQVVVHFEAIRSVRIELGRLHIELEQETRAPMKVSRDRGPTFRAWFDR